MAKERRQPKRPSLRDKVARERSKRSVKLTHQLEREFDQDVANQHATVIINTLSEPKINWLKVNVSIDYLKRFFDLTRATNIKVTKAMRSTERTGQTIPKIIFDQLIRNYADQANLEKILKQIVARRKRELGY